jgi:hypothetical protein
MLFNQGYLAGNPDAASIAVGADHGFDGDSIPFED